MPPDSGIVVPRVTADYFEPDDFSAPAADLFKNYMSRIL